MLNVKAVQLLTCIALSGTSLLEHLGQRDMVVHHCHLQNIGAILVDTDREKEG